jgi:hypothetical protein
MDRRTAALFDSCCKGARDMVSNVAHVHPWILSYLVHGMNESPDLMQLGKVRKNELIRSSSGEFCRFP